MSSIKLIAGLANPGVQYAATRHNIGSRYIQLIAERYYQLLNCTPKFFGYTAELLLEGKNIYLLLPTTFVNLSGKAIASMAKFYHIQPEEIMIAHDDMNLEPGKIKFKQGGSHGGHNGVKDIINKLNNNNFYRLRIGIGHPGSRDKVINFVLSNPPVNEQKLIDCAIHEAILCTELWLKDNKIKAINRLNSFKAVLS